MDVSQTRMLQDLVKLLLVIRRREVKLDHRGDWHVLVPFVINPLGLKSNLQERRGQPRAACTNFESKGARTICRDPWVDERTRYLRRKGRGIWEGGVNSRSGPLTTALAATAASRAVL